MHQSRALSKTNPHELKRGLGNRHLQMIAIGGAIGTGLFMGSGKTIYLAGPSIIFIYAIIGFFLYFVMRAMGEMLLSDLKYHSFRDCVEDMCGPCMGFFTGWTYWACWVTIGMADLSAVTSYVLWWFPECPKWVPAACVLALVLCLNLVAVRAFGEIEFWFALIKIVAIGALIVTALYLGFTGFVSPDGDVASFGNVLNLEGGGMFPNGLMGFLAGFQIAFYAFEGIELAGTAAAETANPEKTLPKAINAIPVRIVVFYVFALAAILTVTPFLSINPEISPFVQMFSLTGLFGAASVVNFVVLTAAASSMNSGVYSTSRMLYGLAQTKLAPKFFGWLSKSAVPANALIFSTVCILPGLAFLYASDTIIEAFTYATTVSSVMFIFAWGSILVAYLRYRVKYPERHEASTYKMPAGRLMCWVVLGFFAVMVGILAMDPATLRAELLSPLWFVFLGAVYLVRKAVAKKHPVEALEEELESLEASSEAMD
ncbi:MAG: amino acid permease [Propionibacteriaceae bacterium]|jgi:D-serine/D-alanine/glycine transporter|nr:amino acid permease [Propionibacteriaceae bacterium]